MHAVKATLAQRDLRLLLSAGIISLTGDWILRVGLTYYVYELTGSTLASALMLLASFIPQVFLSSIAGVFVDRWELRRTMVVADVLLAVGLLPLLAVHRPEQVWIVYAVTAWEGCVQQFFFPAQQSILPRVVDGDYLMSANALSNQSNDLSRLVGSAVGGVVTAAAGIGLLTILDAASFLISALLLMRIGAVSRAQRTERSSLRRRSAQLRTEWSDGLRQSVRHRLLRVIMVSVLITCVGEGIMSTLFAPFVRSVLHASASTYGLIVAMQAVGGIAGGLLIASIGPRLNATRALGAGATAFGAIDLVVFLYPLAAPVIWPTLVLMTVVGVPGALINAGAMTLVQQHADSASVGRIFGAIGAVEGVAMVAGIGVAGLLGDRVGIVPVLAAQGFAYIVAGALVLLFTDLGGRARIVVP